MRLSFIQSASFNSSRDTRRDAFYPDINYMKGSLWMKSVNFFTHTHGELIYGAKYIQRIIHFARSAAGAGATVKRTVRSKKKPRSSCEQCRSAMEKYGASPFRKMYTSRKVNAAERATFGFTANLGSHHKDTGHHRGERTRTRTAITGRKNITITVYVVGLGRFIWSLCH